MQEEKRVKPNVNKYELNNNNTNIKHEFKIKHVRHWTCN